MDKDILNTYIKERLSTREIGKQEGKSQSTVKYWLHKFRLKTNPKSRIKENCNCGTSLIGNKYKTAKGICKKCFNNKRKETFKKTRKKIIKHLGGKCVICSFNKYACSLDVHHKDPSKKDPNFSSSQCWSWKRLEKELL